VLCTWSGLVLQKFNVVAWNDQAAVQIECCVTGHWDDVLAKHIRATMPGWGKSSVRAQPDLQRKVKLTADGEQVRDDVSRDARTRIAALAKAKDLCPGNIRVRLVDPHASLMRGEMAETSAGEAQGQAEKPPRPGEQSTNDVQPVKPRRTVSRSAVLNRRLKAYLDKHQKEFDRLGRRYCDNQPGAKKEFDELFSTRSIAKAIRRKDDPERLDNAIRNTKAWKSTVGYVKKYSCPFRQPQPWTRLRKA